MSTPIPSYTPTQHTHTVLCANTLPSDFPPTLSPDTSLYCRHLPAYTPSYIYYFTYLYSWCSSSVPSLAYQTTSSSSLCKPNQLHMQPTRTHIVFCITTQIASSIITNACLFTTSPPAASLASPSPTHAHPTTFLLHLALPLSLRPSLNLFPSFFPFSVSPLFPSPSLALSPSLSLKSVWHRSAGPRTSISAASALLYRFVCRVREPIPRPTLRPPSDGQLPERGR